MFMCGFKKSALIPIRSLQAYRIAGTTPCSIDVGRHKEENWLPGLRLIQAEYSEKLFVNYFASPKRLL